MSNVRVGVIGTSWYADIAHLPRVKSHPRAELAAICGRNRARAEEMADKYGIPLVYTDYREMIEVGDLDAVIVSTPDDLHYPMTMAALDAGLHVLCEKPMALDRTQAKEMYEKAEAAGVKHMVCFTYRWAPAYRYLKQLLEEGYIGRCYHCRFGYLAGYGRAGRYGWKYDRRRGLGALGDLGSHMIDLARWYVGDIVRVSACLDAFVERPGHEGEALDPANDAAFLTVEFENGAQGMIEISAVAHVGARGQEQQVRLYGSLGTLEADGSILEGEMRGVRHDEEQLRVLPVPDALWGDVNRAQPLAMQIMEAFVKQPIGDRLFIDAILGDQPVVPSFYDGLKVQEVIDAALRSHQRGEWVST
ncbi:MAG TPA: Gfo/Idh/MocA family oxidoreductase, partial [Anaerolineae bacterium]|nr:Gfo/Idh/MocA family oxidoreductase [Anaerolineae bacterium]